MTDFASLRHELRCIVAAHADAQCYPLRSQKCPSSSAAAKPSKQRKASKAFAIYHSRAAAITTRMADVLRKEESEREAEQLFVAAAERQPSCEHVAEEDKKLQNQAEQQIVPATPALTCASESAGSCCESASLSSSLSSLDDFDMPPTPRLRICELPTSPSIVSSPLPPLHSHSEETNPEPEFDPFHDEVALRPLADEWSSLDRTSSLSLASEASDEESWPFNNALGLYVDPAMNVATWDAGGFIRSTAPSPSPSRLRSTRQRN